MHVGFIDAVDRQNFALCVVRMEEALLRIDPVRLNYGPKNFFVEIGVTPWPGIVAQRGANSNSNADAEETVFFF